MLSGNASSVLPKIFFQIHWLLLLPRNQQKVINSKQGMNPVLMLLQCMINSQKEIQQRENISQGYAWSIKCCFKRVGGLNTTL